MTIRQRIIATYASRLTVALHRHVELNPGRYPAVHALEPAFVRRTLLDSMSSAHSPYRAELDALDARGGRAWTRLERAIVRDVERGEGLRPGWWADRL